MYNAIQKIGVSSSCFYPQPTEDSFRKLCENGVKCTELFFNAYSETELSFVKEIDAMRSYYGVDVVAVHPYMSFTETFFLFTDYKRRYQDILPVYKKMFEAMQILGAKYFILHGSNLPGVLNEERYFERYREFVAFGKSFGVEVCNENVVHYRSQSPDFLIRMANALGNDFSMTLDIKQARRAGYKPEDFLDPLSPFIRHIHISDCSERSDCLPPLEGCFDFPSFFNTMDSLGYTGAYIIEVYEHSYRSEDQVFDSYKKMQNLLIRS